MAEIKPALTKEEWAEWLRPDRRHGDRIEGRTLYVCSDCGGEPYAEDVEMDAHKTAAKCLYGQPFGFTHEDVRRHREQAAMFWRWVREAQERSMLQAPNPNEFGFASSLDRNISRAAWHESMASRIAALLPPEGV